MYKDGHQGVTRMPKVYSPPAEGERKSFPGFLKVIIVVVIFLVALTYLIFYSPVFIVKNIVFNDKSISATDLTSLKGQNIFKTNTSSETQSLLAKYPDLMSVTYVRGIPDTIRVKVTFREPKFVWQTNDKYYLVDAHGVAYRIAEDLGGMQVVKDNQNIDVKIGQKIVSENFINFLNSIKEKFDQNLDFKIIQYEIDETTFQLNAITDNGWKIKFDTTMSVLDQLDALKKLISERRNEITEYIDLRVENRVYYK